MTNSFIKKLELAVTDDVDALMYVAKSYYEGENVKRNYKKAFHLYKKAAELGNKEAMFILGYLYIFAKGCKELIIEGIEWIIKSAKEGYTQAENALGHFYETCFCEIGFFRGIHYEFKSIDDMSIRKLCYKLLSQDLFLLNCYKKYLHYDLENSNKGLAYCLLEGIKSHLEEINELILGIKQTKNKRRIEKFKEEVDFKLSCISSSLEEINKRLNAKEINRFKKEVIDAIYDNEIKQSKRTFKYKNSLRSKPIDTTKLSDQEYLDYREAMTLPGILTPCFIACVKEEDFLEFYYRIFVSRADSAWSRSRIRVKNKGKILERIMSGVMDAEIKDIVPKFDRYIEGIDVDDSELLIAKLNQLVKDVEVIVADMSKD